MKFRLVVIPLNLLTWSPGPTCRHQQLARQLDCYLLKRTWSPSRQRLLEPGNPPGAGSAPKPPKALPGALRGILLTLPTFNL